MERTSVLLEVFVFLSMFDVLVYWLAALGGWFRDEVSKEFCSLGASRGAPIFMPTVVAVEKLLAFSPKLRWRFSV